MSVSGIRIRARSIEKFGPIMVMWAVVVMSVGGCQPTVKVEAPDKPITINMNIRIEQEVRIKIEKDAERLLNEKKDIF